MNRLNTAGAGSTLAQAHVAGALSLPYRGTAPDWGGAARFLGARAAILGRVAIGAEAILGAGSVIRADGHFVRIGDDFHLGPRSTVHIAHDLYPTIIGHRVTVGDNAVVHACTVGDDCVIGHDAVILDGSVLAEGVVLEAGAVVFPRSELAGGQIYAGVPARPVRALNGDEARGIAARIRDQGAALAVSTAGSAASRSELDSSVFVAATARLAGRVDAAPNSSIWYGCDLDAGDGEIRIGAGANIQDNSVIRCRPGAGFDIGAGSTIGHNVTLADCRIGARSLVGIGSRIAPGTVIGDDVFLAAGATTEEGQILESGWLYGRRPAVKMTPLDDAKRQLVADTVTMYCSYAQSFLQAEADWRAAASP